MGKFNYENKNYLSKLDTINPFFYNKYLFFIKKYLRKDGVFLDVGFGNGYVLSCLQKEGYKKTFGCEISRLFLKSSSKKVKNLKIVIDNKLPYDDCSFDMVGSFTVLEHVDDPIHFLSEQIRVVKRGGYIIVVCPNLLGFFFSSSRFESFEKVKNIFKVFKKILSNTVEFEKIDPIIRNDFQFDDDAIVLTNLQDIRNFLLKINLKIIYESGFTYQENLFTKIIDLVPILKYFCQSCFIIIQK